MKKQFKLEDYSGEYVMHCKTEEEAKVFCEFLHNHGKKWHNSKSYLYANYFNEYKNRTVYYFNEGSFGATFGVEKDGHIILSFKDFVFDNKEENAISTKDGKICESVFKIGQNVWDIAYGWGQIVMILDTDYPICVKFKNVNASYDLRGYSSSSDNRMLFFEEIPIPESALKPKRWRAEKGGEYYTVTSTGIVITGKDKYLNYDNRIYSIGNYFKTYEEAEAKLQQLLEMLKGDTE